VMATNSPWLLVLSHNHDDLIYLITQYNPPRYVLTENGYCMLSFQGMFFSPQLKY